jgi:NADP-dependent 3-hydroxy acid dehydrogenase YdfG
LTAHTGTAPRDHAHPQTALITGASRGIGRATALRLARQYHIVAAARSAQPLSELATLIAAEGGSCEALPLDVTDWSAVAGALIGRHVDVLINNAGAGPIKPLLDLQPEEWHRMVDLNFSALYHVTRALLPGMIERRAGHIIVIGSIAGRSAFKGGSCYAATKHAAQAFAESLMLEVRDHGVKVSIVNPGSVTTDFSARAAQETWRLTAEEVANAVATVVNTEPDVLIHRLEIRTLAPPGKGD